MAKPHFQSTRQSSSSSAHCPGISLYTICFALQLVCRLLLPLAWRAALFKAVGALPKWRAGTALWIWMCWTTC